MFSSVCTFPMRIIPDAIDHLTAWYAIELYFRFNIDSNLDVLFKTFRRLNNKFSGPAISNKNVRSFYHSDTILSIFSFIAMNSQENVLDSTVFCRLLYQILGSLLRNITYPLWEHIFTLFYSRESSTNDVVLTLRPRALGIRGSNTSFVSR